MNDVINCQWKSLHSRLSAMDLVSRRRRDEIFCSAGRRRVNHDVPPSTVIAYMTNDAPGRPVQLQTASIRPAVSASQTPGAASAAYERNLSASIKFSHKYSRLVVSGWTRRDGGLGTIMGRSGSEGVAWNRTTW